MKKSTLQKLIEIERNYNSYQITKEAAREEAAPLLKKLRSSTAVIAEKNDINDKHKLIRKFSFEK